MSGEVEIVRAEGLALGRQQRDAALREALVSVPAAVVRFATRKAAEPAAKATAGNFSPAGRNRAALATMRETTAKLATRQH